MPLTMAQSDNTLQTVISNVNACETYFWSVTGQTYTSSTVATHLNATSDTLFVLNLTVNHTHSSAETFNSDLCSYTWRGNTYFHSGTYSDTILGDTTLGTCDSFFVALITIPSAEISNINVNTCGSYSWHDSIYEASGVYSDTSTLVNPDMSTCDHIERLTLTITQTMYVTENVENCGNYSWYGTTYTNNGTYTHTESDTVIGCDTLHTLNLTIVVDTAVRNADSACAYYLWHGDTITTSGLYGYNDTNATSGCVTYRSISLNIKPYHTPVNDTTMVGCNSINFLISSIAGNTTKRFSVDTTFDTNLVDRRWNRCYDSTIHLHVIIHKSGYDTTFVNACDSFYWRLNKNTYYKTPATYPTYPFATDSFNCDSIMVLKLTVDKAPVISAINGEWHLNAGDTAVLYPTCTEGASYKWTYGNQTSSVDTLRIPNVQGNIDVTLEASIRYPANNITCYDTSWITIVTFVGIDQAQGSNVTLFPNPTVGYLNIESNDPIRELAIFNTLGQQVAYRYDMGIQGKLDLTALSKGTYTMRIKLQNGETIIRKFIITK